MTRDRLGSAVVGLVLAGLVLTGCASASGSGHAGDGMMNGASQYHSARLTCSPPSSLVARAVKVDLADMGMTHTMGGTAPMGAHMRLQANPATASAGRITLIASNIGWRTHELVILPLAAGQTAGARKPGPDGKVDETRSLGEASNSCAAGGGGGLTSGTVGWITLTLTPGRYELLCNLPNHYADGMHEEIVIT